MAKNLLIVESPAKAKTIKRYLGSGFQVAPSVGHVMDLPKSKLGVDVDHDFLPEYEIIKGKNKVIDGNQEGRQGKRKHLSCDRPRPRGRSDCMARCRAGRQQSPQSLSRAAPRNHPHRGPGGAGPALETQPNLYEAQQARRVLDRLVGYQISPLLWEKVRRGISAGRVQSVALRIIVERERVARGVPRRRILDSGRQAGRAKSAAV